ncbi:Protein TAR1 [Capsicum annuum]|uniref:Protein TAR1 n=1 Tax=Capsicum annuum TaxID=4072 RepID=A0A2G2ZT22_CAPAN|nr:Protein TAR1 [Capsicum annuum]
MFQYGSNKEPTGQRPECADAEASRRRALLAKIEKTEFHEHIESPSFGRPLIHAGPRPESISGPAHRRFTSDRGASPAPILFSPDNFKHSLTLFSKYFPSFPSGTLSLSVSCPYLALDRIHHPIWAAFPNNPTHGQCLVGSADVAFRTPSAPYETSKFLCSGGSMVARLKLKGIDGRAPPGVEPAA